MFLRIKRILMNEVDAGSGNGAAPAPATPDVPQAQGAAVSLTKEAFDAAIASAASKAVADAKDSIFAEARRTFTESKKSKATPAEPASTATPQATQFDPFKMRKLDFALSKLGVSPTITQTQYERAHRDFATESPDDAEGWAKDYFHGWGGAAQAPASAPVTQPVNPTNPQPRTAAPVSDRGSPPVSAVPLEEQKVLSMSPSDREAVRRMKGDKWFTDKVLEESRGQTIKLR